MSFEGMKVLRWLPDSVRGVVGPAVLRAVPSSASSRGFVQRRRESLSSSAASARTVGLLRSARPGCGFGQVGTGGSAASSQLQFTSASRDADRCANRSCRRIVTRVVQLRGHNNSQVRTLHTSASSITRRIGAAQLDR